MRKKVYGRKFSRDYGSRKALFRSLVKAFIEKGLIKTTYIKAKAIQGDLDKLALLSLKNDLNSVKRIVSSLGNDKGSASLLIKKVGSFKTDRKSGFTRIVKLPKRQGDNALMARLEWVDKEEVKAKGAGDKSETKTGKLNETGNTGKKSLKEKLGSIVKKSKTKKD